MLPALERSFEKLEDDTRLLLRELRPLPKEQLVFRPEEQAWSMLDVSEHLMKVEGSLLIDAEKNLGVRVQPVGIRETVGAFVVSCVMKSPIRIKTPGAAATSMAHCELELSAVEACWAEIRLQLRAFLEHVDAAQNRNGLFRHPVSGLMTAYQALAFMRAHLRHHRYQLDRLRKIQR